MNAPSLMQDEIDDRRVADEERTGLDEQRDVRGNGGHDEPGTPKGEKPGEGEEAADKKLNRRESEVEKGKAAHLRGGAWREVLETSASGAPAAGEAVKDLFGIDEIFHRILATADSEFRHSNRHLLLSGLMAGLSIGLTFLARAAFSGALGDDPTGFLENVFYPIGFIFIILGRQQLFTENTLTPVTLVMMRLSSIPRLLELWGIVYLANIIGAALMALFFSTTDVLTPDAVAAAMRYGVEAMEHTWGSLFARGLVAGFMVAGMVWLLHSVRESITRFALVYLIFFLIPSTGLFHCIIGACEIAFFTLEGGTSPVAALLDFQLPVTLGNAFGGLLFVALPNFFRTPSDRFEEWNKLSWREWIVGGRELAGDENATGGK